MENQAKVIVIERNKFASLVIACGINIKMSSDAEHPDLHLHS